MTHSTTKYMDGHATSVGGAVVDSGNFDWDAHADKFPGLTTPGRILSRPDLHKSFRQDGLYDKGNGTVDA